eukprot:TRINITY_DN2217_c0_g1_i2.p1 TRINITY_DN2217_c0_g1~~TRINITY_DN2217_c0_g1_i2.p1  ORF type:complete len:129 (-),score=41.24 TRINITY_DN2217_c0_g1_i2:72-458(-)
MEATDVSDRHPLSSSSAVRHERTHRDEKKLNSAYPPATLSRGEAPHGHGGLCPTPTPGWADSPSSSAYHDSRSGPGIVTGGERGGESNGTGAHLHDKTKEWWWKTQRMQEERDEQHEGAKFLRENFQY